MPANSLEMPPNFKPSFIYNGECSCAGVPCAAGMGATLYICSSAVSCRYRLPRSAANRLHTARCLPAATGLQVYNCSHGSWNLALGLHNHTFANGTHAGGWPAVLSNPTAGASGPQVAGVFPTATMCHSLATWQCTV